MQDKSSPAAETVSPEPQKIRISSAVVLSPAIMSALEDLVTQIAIGPEEVLTRVTSVENIADSQAVDADFYLKAQK